MYISRAVGFAAGALRTQNVASIVSRPLGIQAAVKGNRPTFHCIEDWLTMLLRSLARTYATEATPAGQIR
jgi:hypothetical protein